MTKNAVTRSSILAEFLELVPIQPSSSLRLLEIGTDPNAGTSAAELANLSGGRVVSLSRSSQIIAKYYSRGLTLSCRLYRMGSRRSRARSYHE